MHTNNLVIYDRRASKFCQVVKFVILCKGPFTQAIFGAIFVALVDAIFVARKLHLQIACV